MGRHPHDLPPVPRDRALGPRRDPAGRDRARPTPRSGRHAHRASHRREVDLRGGRAHPARARVPRPGRPGLLLLPRLLDRPDGTRALRGHARGRSRRPSPGVLLLGRGRRQRPLGLAPARRNTVRLRRPAQRMGPVHEAGRVPARGRVVAARSLLARAGSDAEIEPGRAPHRDTDARVGRRRGGPGRRGPRGAGSGHRPRGCRRSCGTSARRTPRSPSSVSTAREAPAFAPTGPPASSPRHTARRSWRPWRRGSTPASRSGPASCGTWRSCAPSSTFPEAPTPTGSSGRRPRSAITRGARSKPSAAGLPPPRGSKPPWRRSRSCLEPPCETSLPALLGAHPVDGAGGLPGPPTADAGPAARVPLEQHRGSLDPAGARGRLRQVARRLPFPRGGRRCAPSPRRDGPRAGPRAGDRRDPDRCSRARPRDADLAPRRVRPGPRRGPAAALSSRPHRGGPVRRRWS